MRDFQAYADSLETLAKKVIGSHIAYPDRQLIEAALDGQASEVLRNSMPLADRRASGAFFTGQQLAALAVQSHNACAPSESPVLDPACGTGDLLLALARHLPLQASLDDTLQSWGELIFGFDLHEPFVRAAKARLALLAIAFGARSTSAYQLDFDDIFPNVQVGDGMSEIGVYPQIAQILMNPPYTRAVVPHDCFWAGGSTSTAALFVDNCITHANLGTIITAILPDVLRTGALYQKWRKRVETSTTVQMVEPFGVFGPDADVDVFVLRVVVGEPKKESPKAVWWTAPPGAGDGVVGDRFVVRVGPVVPFRDPHAGDWYPYLHSRILPLWGIFDTSGADKRRFAGRTVRPPAVVVRRTSRPGMRYRAGATMITGQHLAAVENHLLTLEPRYADDQLCFKLLSILRDDRTNEWLDQRIRCRHLTVSSLKELPWWRS